MTNPPTYNIILIGCGKMGASMLEGWLQASLINHANVLDPFDIDKSLTLYNNVSHFRKLDDLSFKKTDIIILAVKPQIMDDVCRQLALNLPSGLPILSIAAGKDTAYFQSKFKDDTPIIRTMPNTPAAIGKGMTALYAPPMVDEKYKGIAQNLLSSIGETLWIDDETQMNAVTAISGSGPAYVFHLIEALAKSGEKVGLTSHQAMTLARQTVIGSAALADKNADISASILRENVTSPKGTTEAALDVLMDGDFQKILDETVEAAYQRGISLNEQN